MLERTLQALEEGKNVIYDATNLSPYFRKQVLAQLPEHTTKTAVFVDVPVEECIRRQALRDRKVPAEVIQKMARRLIPPSRKEGWDEIVVIH